MSGLSVTVMAGFHSSVVRPGGRLRVWEMVGLGWIAWLGLGADWVWTCSAPEAPDANLCRLGVLSERLSGGSRV